MEALGMIECFGLVAMIEAAELEGKIAELRNLAQGDAKISIADDVKSLEKKANKILADLYVALTPLQKAINAI